MSRNQYSFAFIGCSIMLAIFLSCFSLWTTAKPPRDHHSTLTRASKMKIQIEIAGTEQLVFVTLEPSPTTQDFIKQLPLSLKLSDSPSEIATQL